MNAYQSIETYVARLQPHFQGDIRLDKYSRLLYSTDASIYQVMPLAVLIPRTMEDVHAAVALAAELGVPLLPRTSGSSLAGQAVNRAVIIDFTRHLNRILEVNREEQWVRVQPGVVLDDLNNHLRPFGLKYGPDPASSNRAAMGGIISNNSTGAHSILYGMTVEHVLDLHVILSDGTWTRFGNVPEEALPFYQQRPGLEGRIYRTIHELITRHADVIRRGTPRHWRRCGGYNLDRLVGGVSYRYNGEASFNLARLVCGAEGTLAVITEARLNLVPLPKQKALALVHFNTLYEALAAVPTILETQPAAVELLDHLGLTLCKEVPEYARLLATFMQGTPNCILITEYYGQQEVELAQKIQHLKVHLNKHGIKATVVPALEPWRQANVWTVRKVGLGLLMSIKGDYKPIPFIEDAAVPVEHLAEYVTSVEAFCNRLGNQVAYYAHASAGCIHVRPLINLKKQEEVEKLPEIAAFSAELVSGYGGALSSEHGDGRCRTWLNERFFGPELYALFKQVKATFDPGNILNPGMVVDGQPMTRNLRYGPEYRARAIQTHIDFSEDQGFDRAIEMCNGAGVCRKTTTGTMCPSFIATREEEHSTRGRANLLRAAISGRLTASAFTSPRLYQALDLCVECKACKAECPSSVDMAKIKMEFLAHYYDRHGIPLRARFFADVPRFAAWFSGWPAPLANRLNRLPPVRWLLEKLVGITRRRPLPEFARKPFRSWFLKHPAPPSASNRPKVVLFPDTFTNYHQPWIGRAAVKVLEALGYRVVLPPRTCCGRPAISKAVLHRARALARNTLKVLEPFLQAGIPVVGLEPSCILALREDYRYILPEQTHRLPLEEHVFTWEEFVATHLERMGSTQLLVVPPWNVPLLVHGHCHQKSLVGMAPARRALEAFVSGPVTLIDSSCCGMAGSFGLEKEHLVVSRRMAQHRLLPAIEQADPDTRVVASGFSCRQQIHWLTGRQAFHPAEIMAAALEQATPSGMAPGTPTLYQTQKGDKP